MEKQVIALRKGVNTNPVSGEDAVEFTGLATMVGTPSIPSTGMLENRNGNKYILATVRCGLPTSNGSVVAKTLGVQLYENSLKAAAGIEKNDDGSYPEWESEDQLEEAVDHFESGEDYLTTLRVVESTDGSGRSLLLGNVSHLQSAGIEANFIDEDIDISMPADATAQQGANAVSV